MKALEISDFSMVAKEIKKGNIERASSLMNVLSTNNLNGLSIEGDRTYSYERQDPREAAADISSVLRLSLVTIRLNSVTNIAGLSLDQLLNLGRLPITKCPNLEALLSSFKYPKLETLRFEADNEDSFGNWGMLIILLILRLLQRYFLIYSADAKGCVSSALDYMVGLRLNT